MHETLKARDIAHSLIFKSKGDTDMLKKLLLALAAMIMTMGFAFAQVDVNKANQAELDGVKGIGPAKSKAIVEERKKGGNFKDWDDFAKRVKGIGDKNSVKLSQAGLTVNGESKPGAPASKDAKKEAKKDTKTESKGVKESVKKGAHDVKESAKTMGKDAKAAAVEVKNKVTGKETAKADNKKDDNKKDDSKKDDSKK
jgi:competence protein ComEA